MDYQVEPEFETLIKFDGTSMSFPCTEDQYSELSLDRNGDWEVEFDYTDLTLTPTQNGHGNYQRPEYWVPYLLKFIKETQGRLSLGYQKIGFVVTSRYDRSIGSLTILNGTVVLYEEDVEKIYTLEDLDKEENWQPGGDFYLGPECFI